MEPDSPVSEEKTVKAEEGVTASNIKNTVFKCKELVGVKFLIFFMEILLLVEFFLFVVSAKCPTQS